MFCGNVLNWSQRIHRIFFYIKRTRDKFVAVGLTGCERSCLCLPATFCRACGSQSAACLCLWQWWKPHDQACLWIMIQGLGTRRRRRGGGGDRKTTRRQVWVSQLWTLSVCGEEAWKWNSSSWGITGEDARTLTGFRVDWWNRVCVLLLNQVDCNNPFIWRWTYRCLTLMWESWTNCSKLENYLTGSRVTALCFY